MSKLLQEMKGQRFSVYLYYTPELVTDYSVIVWNNEADRRVGICSTNDLCVAESRFSEQCDAYVGFGPCINDIEMDKSA